MRAFLTSFFFSFMASQALAAITSDELQNLIYQNDIAAVEEAVSAAHKQSLSGEISYEDLRRLTIVLFRTHPDTVDFLERWRAEMPESPYAMTARAWALYNNGGMVRGTAYANRTPINALIAEREMHEEGMDLALKAYGIAPDYVPASDAVIRFQWATQRLWGWQVNKVLSETMQETPNFGTLIRASAGYRNDLPHFCDTFSKRIANMASDVCLVGLLAERGMLDGNWNFAADVLDRSDHPALAYARVLRAIERGTDTDKQLVMDYLDDVDVTFPWLHKEIRVAGALSNLRYFPDAPRDFVRAFQVKLHRAVSDQLVHDPYNLSLIRIAILEHGNFVHWPVDYETTRYKVLKKRIAVVQPYHMSNWTEFGVFESPSVADLNASDIGYTNAMAVSDHSIASITNYMSRKIFEYESYLRRGASVSINGQPWPTEDEFNQAIVCRLATLLRLFEDAAERTPNARNRVDGFRVDHDLAGLEAQLRQVQVCSHIWRAPINKLYFEQIEIDRRSLPHLPHRTYPTE